MDNFLEPYGLDMATDIFFGPSDGHDGRHTCHIRHCPCTLIINNEEKYLDDFVKNFEKKKIYWSYQILFTLIELLKALSRF